METFLSIYIICGIITAFIIFRSDNELFYFSQYVSTIILFCLLLWWVFWIMVAIEYLKGEDITNL